ncbi:unnamed protein product [Ectocarpus sp. 13 AM-2016]
MSTPIENLSHEILEDPHVEDGDGAHMSTPGAESGRIVAYNVATFGRSQTTVIYRRRDPQRGCVCPSALPRPREFPATHPPKDKKQKLGRQFNDAGSVSRSERDSYLAYVPHVRTCRMLSRRNCAGLRRDGRCSCYQRAGAAATRAIRKGAARGVVRGSNRVCGSVQCASRVH